ncbi:hypothetical protein ACFHW2_11675 [Actinomadura sp. LOL_016]|uniref:hypothetical protein n=1 Tax=unclassified Actinomadura TaxID=2626254 RepID=UPI003A80FE23
MPNVLRDRLAEQLGADADRYDLAEAADELRTLAGDITDPGVLCPEVLADALVRHERRAM